MSNEAGEVVSAPASVEVYEPVTFVELPAQVQVFPGETATFNVSTTGTEPIDYQWLYENQPLSGAATKTLILNNVQEAHTGKYRVVASNPAGKVTSPEVRLLILKPAVITTQPTGDVLRQGETSSWVDAGYGFFCEFFIFHHESFRNMFILRTDEHRKLRLRVKVS